MKCPIDDTALMMTERSGIEIDYCPKCRGVWLDRGELDKIIERAAADQPSRASRPEAPAARRPEAEESRGDYRHGREFGRERGHERDDDGRDRKGRRRSSILDDLFDF